MTTKERAQAAFDAHEAALQELCLWMHENPELAYQEVGASSRMAALLQANGFDVTYPAYGLDTAFSAVAGSSGPKVTICAEMDALPGVGQACGHNIIGTAALGAGLAVAPLADELGIRVEVLGTPAEEHYGGKVDLIDAGAFEDTAASMMVHPSYRDVVDPEFLAIEHLHVEFFGKAAHAASSKELGINALDAAVQAYVNVSTLRQQLLDTDRVHGIITHGGDAPNVIPDHTAMVWNVRAKTENRLDEVKEKFDRCIQAAATATGCTYSIERRGHRYSAIDTNEVMAKLYQENSSAAGRTVHRLKDLPPKTSGSTDMGNVSQIVPSIHPMLDLHCYPAVNHQKEFAAHTITDDGMRMIRDGALAMAWTIIDLAEGDRWSDL